MSHYYCKAPWHGLNFTPFGLSPCCALRPLVNTNDLETYLQSPQLKQLQAEHSPDTPVRVREECRRCIESGDSSPYVEFNYESDIQIESRVKHLSIANDIRCGYECNMCFSNDKRYRTLKEMGSEHLDFVVQYPQDEEKFSPDMVSIVKAHLDTLESVTFLGGDPSMNPQTPEVITLLKETNVKVRYYHNGHRRKFVNGENIAQSLGQLKNIHVIVSHDGPGYLSEYQRYGFKDRTFETNIQELTQAIGYRNVEFLCTITNLNVLRLETLLQDYQRRLAAEEICGLSVNTVFNPRWNSPACLPYKLKRSVLKETQRLKGLYEEPQLVQLLDKVTDAVTRTPTNKTDWSIFMYDCAKSDKRHGANILTYYPELKPYWIIV